MQGGVLNVGKVGEVAAGPMGLDKVLPAQLFNKLGIPGHTLPKLVSGAPRGAWVQRSGWCG